MPLASVYSAVGNESHTSRLVGQRASWLLRLRAGQWADVEPTVRGKMACVGDRAAFRKEFTAERAELAEKAFKTRGARSATSISSACSAVKPFRKPHRSQVREFSSGCDSVISSGPIGAVPFR